MEIENSIALVTGANRGVGKVYVEELLKRGVAKVYAAARSPEGLAGPFDDSRLVPLKLDVTSGEDIRAAVAVASHVTLLINNAGALRFGGALAVLQAARDGLGPAMLPDWLVARHIDEGDLVDLFPDHDATGTTFDTGAWALYPSRSYLPGKVRVMIDFLRGQLAARG